MYQCGLNSLVLAQSSSAKKCFVSHFVKFKVLLHLGRNNGKHFYCNQWWVYIIIIECFVRRQFIYESNHRQWQPWIHIQTINVCEYRQIVLMRIISIRILSIKHMMMVELPLLGHHMHMVRSKSIVLALIRLRAFFSMQMNGHYGCSWSLT